MLKNEYSVREQRSASVFKNRRAGRRVRCAGEVRGVGREPDGPGDAALSRVGSRKTSAHPNAMDSGRAIGSASFACAGVARIPVTEFDPLFHRAARFFSARRVVSGEPERLPGQCRPVHFLLQMRCGLGAQAALGSGFDPRSRLANRVGSFVASARAGNIELVQSAENVSDHP